MKRVHASVGFMYGARPVRALVVVAGALLFACGESVVADDLPYNGYVYQDSGVAADATLGDGGRGDAGDGAATTCSDGSPVVAEFASCPEAPASVPGDLATALSSAARGDVISLGDAGAVESTTSCFPVRVCIPASAPKMLFSDSPESPASSGVLYADAVGPGTVRIYVYHTNGGNDGIQRKFPVVVLNQGTTDAHATIVQKGLAGPSANYVAVGKAAITRWLASTAGAPITIPAGQRVLLDSDLDALHAGYNELVHGIIDVSFDAPVKVSVVSVQSGDDAAAVTAGLSLLPADADHQRATFAGAARVIEAEGPIAGDGIRKISLGGNETDANLQGTDAVDGTAASLGGNYGVFYTFLGGVASHDALILVPRGGAWGGSGDVSAGEDADGGALAFPSATESVPADGSAVVVGRFAAGSNVRAHFMSAGGSSLPVHLASVPLP